MLLDYMKKRPPAKHLYDGSLQVFEPFPRPKRNGQAADEVEEAWSIVQMLADSRWMRPECLVNSLNDTGGAGNP